MSLDKLRLRYPMETPENCREEKMEDALEAIKFSRCTLTVFTTDDGFPDILYTEFNEDLFATLVVLMTKYEEFRQLQKMALITSERLEKNPIQGMTVYNQALKFLKENFCDFVKEDKAEI